MLTRLAGLSLACMVGCAAPQPEPQATAPGAAAVAARPAGRATLRIRGEGTELHPVRSTVGLGDVHEALARAGGRRIDPDPATGLEFVIVRDVVVDPIVRALLPESAPPVEWLGIPVRWTTVARDGDTTYELRSFHVITELGPRSIVEFVVREGEQVSARRELVLVQGEALAVTAASPQWPAPAGMRHPPEGGVRRAFGWESESPLALLVLRPRFEGR